MSDSFANELTRNLSMARGSLSGAGLYVIVDDCSPRQQGLGHLNLLACCSQAFRLSSTTVQSPAAKPDTYDDMAVKSLVFVLCCFARNLINVSSAAPVLHRHVLLSRRVYRDVISLPAHQREDF